MNFIILLIYTGATNSPLMIFIFDPKLQSTL